MAAIAGGILGIILVIVWLSKVRKKVRNNEVKGEATTQNVLTKNNTTETTAPEKFVVKLHFGFFWFGLLVMILFLRDIFEFSDGYLWLHIEVGPIMAVMAGLLIMILSLPRMREIAVEKEEINITTMFIFKKHLQFSDIVSCKKKFNGWAVYVGNQRRKAFFIYAIFKGSGLFMERIEDMNIPIK